MADTRKLDAQEPDAPLPAIYDELHSLAGRYLRRQRPGHTLQPTALVHEVYMRLIKGDYDKRIEKQDLLRLAAKAMRNVLVDHARRKTAQKRSSGGKRVPLDAEAALYAEQALDLIALDDALKRLQAFEPRWSTIIEMRFFGGCSEEEIGVMLGVSSRTIRRQWRMARAWLRREIEGGQEVEG
ncbi:MAG: ECF-type sigma factor [Phycisphaerae bacterium]